jgi:hypothetical protein
VEAGAGELAQGVADRIDAVMASIQAFSDASSGRSP